MSGRDKFDRPWFKPPPLDSIDISDEELEKNLLLKLCAALNTVTGITGGLSCILHALIILQGPTNIVDVPFIITRIFFIGFGLMIVLQEREWPPFFRLFTFLESWIGRGLFLVLCASIMISVSQPRNLLRRLCVVVGLLLGVLGLLYLAMGLLCIRQLKIRQLTQIRRRKQVQLQAQQLSAHKSEIERLLQETQSKMQDV